MTQPETSDSRQMTEGEYRHLLELFQRFSEADRAATALRAAHGGYQHPDCVICAGIRRWANSR